MVKRAFLKTAPRNEEAQLARLVASKAERAWWSGRHEAGATLNSHSLLLSLKLRWVFASGLERRDNRSPLIGSRFVMDQMVVAVMVAVDHVHHRLEMRL